MYIALEYLSSVIVVALLGAVLFATSTLLLLGQEGAKYLAHSSRRVADRAIQLVASTAKANTGHQHAKV